VINDIAAHWGASTLAGELLTLPTHQLVGAADLAILEGWLVSGLH
jgi:hypothetical protein